MSEETTTIISSVLSLIAAVIAAYSAYKSNKVATQCDELTNRTNREIANVEQEAENKRNEIRIDASIVWSARVEWIQNVRRVTADFLTAINNYIYSEKNDNELIKKKLMRVKEKSNLLILYFGPDKAKSDNIDLLNENDNDFKNMHMVKLINDIYFGCENYFLNQMKMKTCNDIDSKCKACSDSADLYERCDIYNRKLSSEEQEKECKKYISENQMKCEHAGVENLQLFSNIDKLTNAMRIYLKIEWNRTKERKA